MVSGWTNSLPHPSRTSLHSQSRNSTKRYVEFYQKTKSCMNGWRNALSLVYQPRVTFDQTALYPDVVSKAAALCHSLIMNHPFIDGNKRVGHAAMETFLILNGFEIDANMDEQERIVLDVAAGKLRREEFTSWLSRHITTRFHSDG